MTQEQKRDCVVIPARLTPEEICFVNALIDDHEGMAVCRTVDAKEGRLEFWVAPELVDEFYALAEAIQSYAGLNFELGEPTKTSPQAH